MKNKYIKNTHISGVKTREILHLFCLDIEAEKTAVLTGVYRPTINRFYKSFRVRIAELCEKESPFTNGEIELDESYFGARRVRGIRGRGAKGKIPVVIFIIMHYGLKIAKVNLNMKIALLTIMLIFNRDYSKNKKI